MIGPMFLLLFINDLLGKIASDSGHFADDCIVYRLIKDNPDCEAFQEDLNTVNPEFFARNFLFANCGKRHLCDV